MKALRFGHCVRTGIAPISLAMLGIAAGGSGATPDNAPDRGKAAYDLHCAACHGATGDGKGLASVWLFPRPRDFSAGQFKIQSTPNGSLPADEDLLESITRGVPGTSMPGFAHRPEADRHALVAHTKRAPPAARREFATRILARAWNTAKVRRVERRDAHTDRRLP